MSRLSYEESCKKLWGDYLEEGHIPNSMSIPKYDDEELGINFFKTFVDGEDFSNLTIPHVFFGRSEIAKTSFLNSDLHQSNLCWNDFISVDFSGADLSSSDLRASLFQNVNFSGANLQNCDLRLSSFEECDFSNANLLGAILTKSQQSNLNLSTQQVSEISWSDSDGPEPDGG